MIIEIIKQEDLKNKIMLFDWSVPPALAYRMAEGVDKNNLIYINGMRSIENIFVEVI